MTVLKRTISPPPLPQPPPPQNPLWKPPPGQNSMGSSPGRAPIKGPPGGPVGGGKKQVCSGWGKLIVYSDGSTAYPFETCREVNT